MARCWGRDAFVLRFFGEDGDDRLLVVNLGTDLHLESRAGTAAGAAAKTGDGNSSGRVKIRATAVSGRFPPDTDEQLAHSRAMPPWSMRAVANGGDA